MEKDATIGTFAYTADNATVAAGNAFRGWFQAYDGSGNRKFTVDDVVTADLTLYGRATEIEVQSKDKRYYYGLTDQYFYPEDHEGFVLEGSGKFHDSAHGWQFANGDVLKVLVGGNAHISAQLCRYGNEATITIKNSQGEELGTIATPASTDGQIASFDYEGPADQLQLVFSGAPYIHSITIVNDANSTIVKNAAGWYVVKAGDADNLLSTISVANGTASNEERTYIYVPAGTYDLGETVLTPISGNNISIIGEGAGKTIIKNAPKVENEGIGTTATFLVNGENTYFQDLTLQNALDYYSAGSAGRAVVIQDKGNRTICKNVNLLSFQDTYYSNANGQYYFEDGEIHGTVDYVCGSGDVFYNRVKFVNESRSATESTGDGYIAAPYTATSCQWGYVMRDCTIETLSKSFTLGRAWGDVPRLAWINTTILQPSALKTTRFTTAGMNVVADRFVEYNTMDADGNVISPESNILTFTKDKNSKEAETIISAEEAALYTLENVFTDWAPADLTQQAVMSTVKVADGQLSWTAVDGAAGYAIYRDGQFVDITSATTFAIGENGTYTVRAANAMGGLGTAVEAGDATAISAVDADADNYVYYTIGGTRLTQPQRGVNIRVARNGKAEKVVVK